MMRFKLSQKAGLYNCSVNIALIYLLGQKNKTDFFKLWLKDFVIFIKDFIELLHNGKQC